MSPHLRVNILVVFSVLTAFGSSLSAIGTFLALGRSFKDLGLIALALALKSLSSVVFTYFTRRYAQKEGVYSSMVLSQLLGIPTLGIMLYGFESSSSNFVLWGLFLSGIPGNLFNLVFGPLLKEISTSNDSFKERQGAQQVFLGIGSLLAGLISPWLLDFGGIIGLYALDAFTFFLVAAYLVLNKGWLSRLIPEKLTQTIVMPKNASSRFDIHKTLAFIYIIPTFIFTGLIPIFASSGFAPKLGQPAGLVERLWMAESFANMAVGYLYFRFVFLRTSRTTLTLPLYCSLPLVLVFLNNSGTTFYLGFLMYSMMSAYGITRYRDDLLTSAEGLFCRINYQAFYLFLINAIRTISAPILWLVLNYEMSQRRAIPLRSVIGTQLLLGTLALLAVKKKGSYELRKS